MAAKVSLLLVILVVLPWSKLTTLALEKYLTLERITFDYKKNR